MPPRKLQPFLAPEALNLLVVDLPALDPQQFGYLAVAVAVLFSMGATLEAAGAWAIAVPTGVLFALLLNLGD